MPIWDPSTGVSSAAPSSTPIWMPGGAPAAPSSTPIWMPPGGFPPPPAAPPSGPQEVVNPALPIWHPDRYGPAGGSSSGEAFKGGGGKDQPRAPATPIVLNGQPLDQSTGTGVAAPTSPLLPTVDELESNANFAFLQQILNSYGLGDAYDTMVDLIADDASPAEIQLAIRDTDVFRQRFPQIFEREQNGQTPLSPADVINYETGLEQMFSFYGVPDAPGLSIQEQAAQLMSNDVSLNEVTARLTAQRAFARAVLEDPDQDLAAVQSVLGDYGGTLYDIANLALDPEKTLAELQQRFEAAEIANEAAQAEYRISGAEAIELQRQGLTGQQATAGFGALVQQSQVVDGLGNEDDPVTRAQELAALTGDVAANVAVENARRRRTGAFEVGGGFGRDDDGFGGLR